MLTIATDSLVQPFDKRPKLGNVVQRLTSPILCIIRAILARCNVTLQRQHKPNENGQLSVACSCRNLYLLDTSSLSVTLQFCLLACAVPVANIVRSAVSLSTRTRATRRCFETSSPAHTCSSKHHTSAALEYTSAHSLVNTQYSSVIVRGLCKPHLAKRNTSSPLSRPGNPARLTKPWMVERTT